MTKPYCVLFVSCWLALGGAHGVRGAEAGERPAARRLSAKELFAEAAGGLVKVLLYDPVGNRFGSGSGFIVSPAGLVVTNYHVIEFAGTTDNIRIKLAGKLRTVRGVCSSMPKEDLALLAMETTAGEKLPHLAIADKTPAQGEQAYAIGYPLGLANPTITDGLINGLQKILGVEMLQTSAPISKGSSGGPLLIADGTVVGVNCGSLARGQNMNFAVPVEQIHKLLKGAGKPRKEVPRFSRPVAAAALPRIDKPVDLRGQVDLKDRSVPMTLKRLYAGMVQKYVAMGLARPDLTAPQQKKLFRDYIQLLCRQDIIGRRITCELRVLSLAKGHNRVRQIQFLRRQVPRSNPPGPVREYQRLLRDAGVYSALAICKSPYWPRSVYAYLHKDHAGKLAHGEGGGPVRISGFISQWTANAPPGGRLDLSVTLDACTLAGSRVPVDENEARAKLNLAKVYIDAAMTERAVKTLDLVVRSYPDTQAAKEAARLLGELKHTRGPAQ